MCVLCVWLYVSGVCVRWMCVCCLCGLCVCMLCVWFVIVVFVCGVFVSFVCERMFGVDVLCVSLLRAFWRVCLLACVCGVCKYVGLMCVL